MAVEIETADAKFFGAVMSDLTSQRRGVIDQIKELGNGGKKITCHVPLKELMVGLIDCLVLFV
jgi:translation elongation factor EF-G